VKCSLEQAFSYQKQDFNVTLAFPKFSGRGAGHSAKDPEFSGRSTSDVIGNFN
jgi:hypothetical protein